MSAAAEGALLAKGTRKGRPPVTLQEHSFDTERAAEHLFAPTKRFGHAFCRFFRIAAEQRERFLLNLRVAALFHDIGKANEDFRAAAAWERFEPQTVRHEHISALVLCLPDISHWLSHNKDLDLDVIRAAVLSHHLKASESGDRQWGKPVGGKSSVALFLQHSEVASILSRVQACAELPAPPLLPARRYALAPPWSDALRLGRDAATRFRRLLSAGDTASRRGLLVAVKAGLMAADAASSALVRESLPLDAWIEEAVHAPALSAEAIEEAVLLPRFREIERRRGAPFVPHLFQEATARLGPRALVQAACGAGKTIAAWKWAAAQARERDISRVVFLYPTRGTATEGFRDYVAGAPEGEGALVHAQSRYELDAMRENPAEEAKAARHSMSEADARLFALGLWSRRYFSATVDQFLGFLEHAYPSLCLLPVLADSAVIIDEVHSFDQAMFRSLLAFLEAFDVPVLCMTATLQPSRRKELIDRGLIVYPREEHRKELSDLEALETHPRYHIAQAPSAQACLDIALKAYREGKRVLWVENQVAHAQARAREIASMLGASVLCYHSRFRLQDRQRVHRATVEAFQHSTAPAIAVTTQVCEMSLDLDADVLITALAPSTALVQRMGRANRHLARGRAFRAQVLVYDTGTALPYSPDEQAMARTFVEAIAQGDTSQRQLADALIAHSRAQPTALSTSRFLEAGYYATPGPFRDADAYTRPSILRGDLEKVQEAFKQRKPVDGWVVPAPHRVLLSDEGRPSFLPSYYGVVDSALYDERLGLLSGRDEDDV